MNSVNGPAVPGGGGVAGSQIIGGPLPMATPAGHQAELNYIYSMVEELSRQLAENRKATEDIVVGLGEVRNRAKQQGTGNEELINSTSDEMRQKTNLDSLVSVLSESLDKAKHSRDANAALLSSYANVIALLLKQVHDYKEKHVTDISAWHKSYRTQLDEARQENSKLREQIWEMQSHAGIANEQLRLFRRKYDANEHRWVARVYDKAARQELRFWKRMAMPEIADDDSLWSDDDDLIDAAEKIRLRELEAKAQQEQMMSSMADDSDEQEGEDLEERVVRPNVPMHVDNGIVVGGSGHGGAVGGGGVAMQRESGHLRPGSEPSAIGSPD